MLPKAGPKPVPLTSIKGFTRFASINTVHVTFSKASLKPIENEDYDIVVPVPAKDYDDIAAEEADDKSVTERSVWR